MKTRLKIAAAVGLLIGVTGLLVYLGSHDPEVSPAPKCTFKLLTGYDCPGCGAQRAIHAILNGNPAEAWRFNPMMFILIPLGIVYTSVELFPSRFPRLRRLLMHPASILGVAGIIIAWWIIRNL